MILRKNLLWRRSVWFPSFWSLDGSWDWSPYSWKSILTRKKWWNWQNSGKSIKSRKLGEWWKQKESWEMNLISGAFSRKNPSKQGSYWIKTIKNLSLTYFCTITISSFLNVTWIIIIFFSYYLLLNYNYFRKWNKFKTIWNQSNKSNFKLTISTYKFWKHR